MKKSIKRSLIITALGLVACLVGLIWLVSRSEDPGEPISESVLDTSQGPAFKVRVGVPRGARPLGGILPDWVVGKLDGTPSELRFDNTSRGVKIGTVGHDHLELSADGWDLLIETDVEGRVTSGTHLVFRLALGGRQVRLNCRPADRANGYFRTTTQPSSDKLGGRFLIELPICANAESGRTTNWPPSPLTVRGSFEGLPQGRR